jgi:hypothetical protein
MGHGMIVIWIFGSLAALAVLLWPIGAIYRSHANVSRGAMYTALADRSVAAEESAQKNLAEVKEELVLMRAQMASLTKVLTEVE